MLAQFQSLYPNGNLISELIQIFQGKYVVRASVQIEGVTRATGMAAAETIEVAEDQARSRALMVLGITNSPQVTASISPTSTSQPAPSNPDLNLTVPLTNTYSSTTDRGFGNHQWSVASSKEIPIPPTSEEHIKPDITSNPKSASKSETYGQDLSQNFPVASNREIEYDPLVENSEIISDNQPETPLFSGIAGSNVTPFTPRSYSSQENVSTQTTTGKKKKKTEPVDLSDIIAKTDIELQRLGWKPEQGREYLIKTYGKRGRTLLNEEELLDFLRYLESQPDPLAGF